MTLELTVDARTALERINTTEDADFAEVERCFALAAEYATVHVGDVVVPQPVLDEAVLRATVALFAKAHAPNGVLMSSYDDVGDGSAVPIRVSSDPLYEIRVTCSPYIAPLGFA